MMITGIIMAMATAGCQRLRACRLQRRVSPSDWQGQANLNRRVGRSGTSAAAKLQVEGRIHGYYVAQNRVFKRTVYHRAASATSVTRHGESP